MTGFLSRHQGLRRYRVGTMEEGRARNSRPDVVARWNALLTLLYRDHAITSARQVWNMNETHVHARTSAVEGRGGIIRGVGLRKPEVVLPSFASGAGACTAAFCVSAGGVVAPHFVVVDGQATGHAFVTTTERDGGKQDKALATFLNDGAIVRRRSPPGFTKEVFDVWAQQFASFARSYYPGEAKILSLDGAKVHLSPAGLLTLLRANVHVIAEPSKMPHILQALDNSSAFGRYQPKVRSRVREAALECRDAGRQFNTPDLMRFISAAASDTLTEQALRTAFRRVGMWPLDPTVVSDEELSKGADAPVAGTDLELLTRRLIPVVRKDMSCPRVVNGILSTAGRGTVLTADEVIAAISVVAAAREAEKLAKSHAKRAREANAKENKSLESIAARAKRAKLQEKQDKFLCKTWDEIASDAANDGACRLRAMGLMASTAANLRCRALASRARRGAPLPLSPNELWRVVSAEAAEVGKQQLR